MASFERFLGRAFRQGPAEQANQLIAEVRRTVQAEQGAAVNYEVVLSGRMPEYLSQEVAPRLAFFLRSKRYRVGHCLPVFLSMFFEDRVYFVSAQDFFDELRQSEGLTAQSFAELARSWEESGRRAVAALPSADLAHAAESVSLRPGNGTGAMLPGAAVQHAAVQHKDGDGSDGSDGSERS